MREIRKLGTPEGSSDPTKINKTVSPTKQTHTQKKLSFLIGWIFLFLKIFWYGKPLNENYDSLGFPFILIDYIFLFQKWH